MTRQSTKDPDVLLFKPSVNNNNNIIQPRKYETKNKKSKKRQNSSASRRSSVSTELHSNVLKMKGGFIKGQCVNFLTNTGKWKYGRLQDIDSILGRGKVIYIDGRLREVWVCTTHLKLISQQNEMSVNIGDVVLAYRQSSKAMIPGVVLHYNQLKEQMCIKFYDGLIEDNVHYRIIQNLDGIELGNVIVETSLESLQLIRSTECDIHKEKSPAKLSINASTESDTANKEYNFESFVFKPLVKSMKTPRKSKCKTSSLILSGLKENKHAFNHPSQECHQDIITSPPYVLDESKQMDSQNSHHTDSIGSEIHISKQPSPTRTISVYSSNSSLNNNETEKRVEEANCIESVEITPVTDTDEIIVVDSDVVSPNDGSCVPSRIADDQEFLSSHEHVDAVECSPTTNSIPRINSIQISTNKRRRFSRGRFIPVARRKKRPREAMVNNEVVESAVDNSNSSSDRSTVVDQSLLVSPKCKKIKIIDGVSDENLAKDQQHFDIFKHIVEINSEQLEIPSTYKMFFDTTKQTERSTFECPFVECGRVFGREDLLNTHIQYCHDHAIEEERVITVPIDCNSVQAISIQSTRNDFLPTPYIVVHCSCGDKTMTEDMLQCKACLCFQHRSCTHRNADCQYDHFCQYCVDNKCHKRYRKFEKLKEFHIKKTNEEHISEDVYSATIESIQRIQTLAVNQQLNDDDEIIFMSKISSENHQDENDSEASPSLACMTSMLNLVCDDIDGCSADTGDDIGDPNDELLCNLQRIEDWCKRSRP